MRCNTEKDQSPLLAQVSIADHLTSQYFVAYPHLYSFTLDEPNRCRQESPFLVLMIPVAPHNRRAREVIRKTWGKESTVSGQAVSHYFLLGMSSKESETEQVSVLSFKITELFFSISLDIFDGRKGYNKKVFLI